MAQLDNKDLQDQPEPLAAQAQLGPKGKQDQLDQQGQPELQECRDLKGKRVPLELQEQQALRDHRASKESPDRKDRTGRIMTAAGLT